MQDIQFTASTMQTTKAGGERRAGGRRSPGGDGEAEGRGLGACPAAPSLFPPLHHAASALLVLLAVLGVACEDKVVIVELSQLAVETLVALKLLGRRKDAATFGALQRQPPQSGSARTQLIQEERQTSRNHTPD